MAVEVLSSWGKKKLTLRGTAGRLLFSARRRARNKEIGFSISRDWIEDTAISNKLRCHRTGIPFDFSGESLHPFQMSLDRLDSRGAYSPDNVEVVCLMYNLCKSTRSYEEVMVFARALVGYSG